MNQLSNMWRFLPPVTKYLIIINFIVWLAMLALPRALGIDPMKYGALHYVEAPDFNFAQLFTYMFMHSVQNITHILFNMFTLFMFGTVLERVLGSNRFLFFYITCGVGAAIIQEGVWGLTLPGEIVSWLASINHTSVQIIEDLVARQPEIITDNLNVFDTVGASGAIYGVLLAFGMIFPNRPMYLMFIPVPVKAKWMVTGFVVIELLIGLSQANDGVAHYAHLGGMLVGFLIILFWKKKGVINGTYY